MNRTFVLAVALGAFVCGFGVGILSRHRLGSTDEIKTPSADAPRSNTPASSRGEDSNTLTRVELEHETVSLRKRVMELEADLRALQPLARKSPETESSRDFAEHVFEDYLELDSSRSKNPDPDKFRGLLGRLGRLDDKSSEYFIERYRKAKQTEDGQHEKAIALELALASGGPRTAEFVNILLNDPTLEPIFRENLLSEISGMSGSFFSIKRLPVSPGLESTAMTLVRSEKPEERRGAAGLLGGVRNEIARTELRRLVEQDSDLRVKAAAALSLGHVGDVATRTYLETLWASNSPSFAGEEGSKVRGAIETALKELSETPR